ncbi:hypothetical protein CB1_000849026 [Camelus ferus]|nr:hypothetical protein CB1_000849026 [Camelus ferus]
MPTSAVEARGSQAGDPGGCPRDSQSRRVLALDDYSEERRHRGTEFPQEQQVFWEAQEILQRSVWGEGLGKEPGSVNALVSGRWLPDCEGVSHALSCLGWDWLQKPQETPLAPPSLTGQPGCSCEEKRWAGHREGRRMTRPLQRSPLQTAALILRRTPGTVPEVRGTRTALAAGHEAAKDPQRLCRRFQKNLEMCWAHTRVFAAQREVHVRPGPGSPGRALRTICFLEGKKASTSGTTTVGFRVPAPVGVDKRLLRA